MFFVFRCFVYSLAYGLTAPDVGSLLGARFRRTCRLFRVKGFRAYNATCAQTYIHAVKTFI